MKTVAGTSGAQGKANGGSGAKAAEKVATENAVKVNYRQGESLAEHLKLNDGVLDVSIPAEAASSANTRLRSRHLWGTDVYTADSDLVAVLTHVGYYRPSGTVPPNLETVHAVVRAAPHPEEGYPSTSRNGIRSRSWGSVRDGCGFVVVSARAVTTSGAEIELTNTSKQKVSPTFFPIEKEHVIQTRNTTSSAAGKKGLIREVTIQYNLCNEPWMKYSISLIADQGFKRSQWTCARLRRDVLYLETHCKRYELSRVSNKSGDEDRFRWALSKKPLPLDVTREVGVPLPKTHVDTSIDDLSWDEIQWGANSVCVRGKTYRIARLQYLPRSK